MCPPVIVSFCRKKCSSNFCVRCIPLHLALTSDLVRAAVKIFTKPFTGEMSEDKAVGGLRRLDPRQPYKAKCVGYYSEQRSDKCNRTAPSTCSSMSQVHLLGFNRGDEEINLEIALTRQTFSWPPLSWVIGDAFMAPGLEKMLKFHGIPPANNAADNKKLVIKNTTASLQHEEDDRKRKTNLIAKGLEKELERLERRKKCEPAGNTPTFLEVVSALKEQQAGKGQLSLKVFPPLAQAS